MLQSEIAAIEFRLGSSRDGPDEWQSDNPDWDISSIVQKTGIWQTWVARPEETALDLAEDACGKLLDRGARADVDALILVTQTPDYHLPTSACLLQSRLNLPQSAMCFDVNLGCSGFIYGLALASSLLESHLRRNVLLVCADTYNKLIDPRDRTTRTVFSDAAAATLIRPAVGLGSVGPFSFGTDGSRFESLAVYDGAARSSYEPGSKPRLRMDGAGVFMFTTSTVVNSIREFMQQSSVEVDAFVFHQASKLVIDHLTKNLGIPEERTVRNLDRVGNTVSASIPIALKQAHLDGQVRSGDTLLLAGFGVGLSWGTCLLGWGME
ncbi:MAG: 3-oxoacyl-ACP synthase [Gammaproteobacteria bacterium]|nr:3-oxoacyl-ACP synthase [Gammaproteobacteria bacterium]|tara:strand:+ start:18007 stop:18975 length:969 start_codon:yes stop_codon:yes gene_type:complete